MLGKSFRGDLDKFEKKLLSKENFAFVRFSDGEADILKNMKLVISDNYVIEGDFVHNFGYKKDDHKHFDPEEHQFVRQKLIESFKFSKENYYTGIACPCCIGGHQAHTWMKREINRSSTHLTWANLFVNGNYSAFLEKIVPALEGRKVVLICSKNANIETAMEKLKCNIVKDFRVGENCIVNDHHLIGDIRDWIKDNSIKDHVFLFSASSLSEILIHELFKSFDENTYMDIGTCLHPYFELGYDRDYLKGYWGKGASMDSKKMCTWNLDARIVENERVYWEEIRNLRNDEEVKKGFIEQEFITEEVHMEFMKKHSDKYLIALCENEFAGYVGVIKEDIRVAVAPRFQGIGIGKYMISKIMEKYPNSCAKIKPENKASLALFKACGFTEKYYILER